MLDAGEVIVPGFRQARALHAWTGARPLFKDERAGEGGDDTRHMSRGLALVDHLRRDGVSGFLTITGGKLTTYRLMAETVVDAMCEQMGDDAPLHAPPTSPCPARRTAATTGSARASPRRRRRWPTTSSSASAS